MSVLEAVEGDLKEFAKRLRGGLDLGECDVSVFVDNMLDSAPLLSRTSSTQSNYYQVSTWRPRTVGMTLVYRY